ncbi:MAG: class I SAM-dependent methyltransferase [Alphaproteobacteria bacterium GM202ARS2]|nr:class I SAM-dependent methyltransferase [Alphaproteobacteria bacterium GM202ARS2]
MHTQNAVDLFVKTLDTLREGQMTLTLDNGTTHQFTSNNPKVQGQMRLDDNRVIARLLTDGLPALFQDYAQGKWHSDNLMNLAELVLRNQSHMTRMLMNASLLLFKNRVIDTITNRNKTNANGNTNGNTNGTGQNGHLPPTSTPNNDFYACWLDETMTYSSGLFLDSNDTLEQAQLNKYDRILQQIGSQPCHILDIGCGWGAFARRAIDNHKHTVTAATISHDEYQLAQETLKDDPQAQVIQSDFRTIKGTYDAVAAIEMCVYVSEKQWKPFFHKLASLLTPGGRAVIQTFVINGNHKKNFGKFVYPIRQLVMNDGIALNTPEKKAFLKQARQCGFRIDDVFSFGADYARTIEHWLQRFDSHQDRLKAMNYDESFLRLWRFYLSCWAAGFRAEDSDVIQLTLSKRTP